MIGWLLEHTHTHTHLHASMYMDTQMTLLKYRHKIWQESKNEWKVSQVKELVKKKEEIHVGTWFLSKG